MNKRALAVLMTVALVAVQPMTAFAARSSSSDSVVTTPTATPTTTTDGKSLTTNGAGSKTENVKLEFAVGAAETAGLPQSVVASINSINSGKKLSEAVGNASLEGYAALGVTSAIVTKDAATGKIADVPTSVTLYIPNLISNLQNVKILYYENATGQWKVLEPTAIDFNTKTVSFNVVGSGTVTIIHK